MAAARRTTPIGRRVLLGVRITHWDRAGQTGSRQDLFGEIVATHAGWVTAITADTDPFHVPAAKLFRAAPGKYRIEPQGALVEPELIGFLDVVRDFHAPPRRDVRVRWLGRAEALKQFDL